MTKMKWSLNGEGSGSLLFGAIGRSLLRGPEKEGCPRLCIVDESNVKYDRAKAKGVILMPIVVATRNLLEKKTMGTKFLGLDSCAFFHPWLSSSEAIHGSTA